MMYSNADKLMGKIDFHIAANAQQGTAILGQPDTYSTGNFLSFVYFSLYMNM